MKLAKELLLARKHIGPVATRYIEQSIHFASDRGADLSTKTMPPSFVADAADDRNVILVDSIATCLEQNPDTFLSVFESNDSLEKIQNIAARSGGIVLLSNETLGFASLLNASEQKLTSELEDSDFEVILISANNEIASSLAEMTNCALARNMTELQIDIKTGKPVLISETSLRLSSSFASLEESLLQKLAQRLDIDEGSILQFTPPQLQQVCRKDEAVIRVIVDRKLELLELVGEAMEMTLAHSKLRKYITPWGNGWVYDVGQHARDSLSGTSISTL